MVGVRFTRWIDAGFDLTSEHVAEGAQFEDVIGVIAAYGLPPPVPLTSNGPAITTAWGTNSGIGRWGCDT